MDIYKHKNYAGTLKMRLKILLFGYVTTLFHE